MFKQSLKFSLLFLLLLSIQFLGIFYALPYSTYTGFITIAVLSALFVSSTKSKGRFHRRMFFGLLALLGGELTIMFIDPTSGALFKSMIWRAIAYLFFISAFYLDFRSAPELDKKGARIAIMLALICSFSIYLYFRPFLGLYRIPILVYTFILSLMSMMASFRRLRVNQESFVLILLGIVVLIASDILMALHTFVVRFDAAYYLVGGTHILALCLIVVGGIKRMLHLRESAI